MLPENSAADTEALEAEAQEPEAVEQTEASVIPTVGIVIESGEQVSSTLSSTYYTKAIYIGLWFDSHCTTPTPSEYLPLVHDEFILLPNKLICNLLAWMDKLKF